MKRTFLYYCSAAVLLLATVADARDLGVLVLPVHEGKFTSSLLYEHLKFQDDFDARGRVDVKSQVVGAVFSYGLTDQWGVAVKGGSLIDPSVEAQGSRWESRSGYLYGLDLYNEVFPATPGYRPGVQLSLGATGFLVPFDRLISNNTVTLIDEKQTGVEYHGAVVATFKVGIVEPYGGVRVFGSNVNWQNNQATTNSSDPDHITGHAHGNISLVVGAPVRIAKDVQFEIEGRFVNETAITTGFTVAVF